MTTPLSNPQIVTLDAKGGSAPAARIWDIPYTMPVKDLSIFVTSLGKPMPASGVDWEVFYGGNWSVGQPFAVGSALSGGVSQGSGNLAATAAEIAEYLYTETKIFPPNNRLRLTPPYYGPAVSVEFDNQAAVAVTLLVFFLGRQLGDYA